MAAAWWGRPKGNAAVPGEKADSQTAGVQAGRVVGAKVPCETGAEHE